MKILIHIVTAFILLVPCYAQKENLRLKLVKGETYTQKTTYSSTIDQTISDKQNKIIMSGIGKASFRVLAVEDTIYELEAKFISLRMKMTLPSGIIEFNSEKYAKNDIFSAVMNAVTHKPFNIVMTKTGRILKVDKYQALWENAFDKLPQLTEEKRERIKNQLMQAYSEKVFKGNIEMQTAIFPELPVSVGDKWKINTISEAAMVANLETNYKLENVNNSYCVISGIGKIETAHKEAYIETNGMSMKYDMSGTITSTIKINRKSGWIIESKINSVMKGNAYIKDSPQMPGSKTIPIKISNETTITEK